MMTMMIGVWIERISWPYWRRVAVERAVPFP